VKIAVCMKQVPDTEAKIKVSGDGKSVDLEGVELVVNPYDEFAVEEALKTKEKVGEGEVVIVCYGQSKASTSIRTCLAMGADRAVFLKDDSPRQDPTAVATALAQVLKEIGPDLILFGKQAVDDDNAQVGPMVAELLGMPSVTAISKFDLEGMSAKVEREVEGGTEVWEVTLPAVVTAHKGLNEPRYASLKGIMAAKKKPIEEKEPVLGEDRSTIEKFEAPPEREGGKIVGEGKEAVAELVRLLKEEAKIL